MARDVFGGRMDRDVDSQREGLEVERRSPSRIHDRQGAGRMGSRGDGRHILDLEGQGAGRLHEDRTCLWTDQPGDACPDARIVELGIDAESTQHAVAEGPRRIVGVVCYEEMVAGLQDGEEGAGNRRQARRGKAGAEAALHCRDGLLQRERARRAVDTVCDRVSLEDPPRAAKLLKRRPENCRGTVHGYVDHAAMGLRVTPGMGCDGRIAGTCAIRHGSAPGPGHDERDATSYRHGPRIAGFA